MRPVYARDNDLNYNMVSGLKSLWTFFDRKYKENVPKNF